MERYWCIRGGLGEGGMRNSRRVGCEVAEKAVAML